MRKVLATLLSVFLVLGQAAVGFAADPVAAGDAAEAISASEGAPSEPDTAEVGQGDSQEATEQPDGADADLKKRFTRHRPGACPEGPPCKVD